MLFKSLLVGLCIFDDSQRDTRYDKKTRKTVFIRFKFPLKIIKLLLYYRMQGVKATWYLKLLLERKGWFFLAKKRVKRNEDFYLSKQNIMSISYAVVSPCSDTNQKFKGEFLVLFWNLSWALIFEYIHFWKAIGQSKKLRNLTAVKNFWT